MKFAVFAALVASSNALTGCKKGIQGKVYTDSTCSKDAHSSFNLIEKHISETGKCNPHTPDPEEKLDESLKTATKNLNAAKKVSKTKLAAVNAVDKIQVDDDTVTTGPKIKKLTVAE